MTIRVLLFANLARELGRQQLTLTLSDNATAAEALDALATQYPKMAPVREQLALAVNMGYVKHDHVLRENDELALIPPVSGG